MNVAGKMRASKVVFLGAGVLLGFWLVLTKGCFSARADNGQDEGEYGVTVGTPPEGGEGEGEEAQPPSQYNVDQAALLVAHAEKEKAAATDKIKAAQTEFGAILARQKAMEGHELTEAEKAEYEKLREELQAVADRIEEAQRLWAYWNGLESQALLFLPQGFERQFGANPPGLEGGFVAPGGANVGGGGPVREEPPQLCPPEGQH